jgi:hypothetical protein
MPELKLSLSLGKKPDPETVVVQVSQPDGEFVGPKLGTEMANWMYDNCSWTYCYGIMTTMCWRHNLCKSDDDAPAEMMLKNKDGGEFCKQCQHKFKCWSD